MKKILLGILVGVVGTVLVQKAWVAYRIRAYQASPEFALPGVVEHTINQDLPRATFHDVSWSTSTARVNYAHDRLYDVNVSYERDGQIKHFTAVFGYSKNPRAWITPSTSDLEILDDEAEVIHTKRGTAEPNIGKVSSEPAPSAAPDEPSM